MKTFNQAYLLGFASIFLFFPSITSAQAPPEEQPETVPHVFQAGEPATAAEMNENFKFLLERVTTLEENATKLFQGINIQTNYELVSSQTVLVGNVEEQGDDAAFETYVAKGMLNLNANNTWSLEISEQEHELSQIENGYINIDSSTNEPEYISRTLFNVQQTPTVEFLSGIWTLVGNTLTLSNAGGLVVSFSKSMGGDMLISPNNEIRAEGDRRRAVAGSVVAIKVSESGVVLTAPANDASYTASSPDDTAMITVSADAAGSDGTVTKVEFLANGSVIGTDFDSPYSISWEAPAGNYKLTARATDNSGTISTTADEADVNITVLAD